MATCVLRKPVQQHICGAGPQYYKQLWGCTQHLHSRQKISHAIWRHTAYMLTLNPHSLLAHYRMLGPRPQNPDSIMLAWQTEPRMRHSCMHSRQALCQVVLPFYDIKTITVSVCLILQGKTPLDLAVSHDDSPLMNVLRKFGHKAST